MNIGTLYRHYLPGKNAVTCFMFISAVLFIFCLIVRADDSDKILLNGRKILRARIQINRVMRMKGPAAAYAYAKTLFPGDASATSQHLIMHIFAELAYARYGIDGMVYCDSDFVYGCYHGFMAQAIIHEGLGQGKNLFTSCSSMTNMIACQHGIGHGIQQHMGSRHLKDALDTCVQIGASISASGCFGGVYMEYHFPGLTTGGIETALPFDPNDPYGVCPELPSEYQPSCYFRLVERWEQVTGRDYRMMGDLCIKIDTEDRRTECFVAIGATSITTSGHNQEEAEKACKLATQVEKYREACVRGLEIHL